MSADAVIALDLLLVLAVILLIITAVREKPEQEASNSRLTKKKRDPEWLKEPEGPGPAPPSYDYVLTFG